MSAALTMLERKIPNNLNCLYLLNRPVYQIRPDNRLGLAKEYATAGNVVAITIDEQERYHIDFAARPELVLAAKKIQQVSEAPISPSSEAFLTAFGFHLPPTEPIGLANEANPPSVMPLASNLTAIPDHYVIVDCEFGNLFQRTSAANVINWEICESLGLKTNILQLSAISFAQHQQGAVFFNRYFDNQYFLPEKKLAGLAATGLTLAAYERQGAPLVILRAWIAQVLQPQLPLVFWDQTQDLKYLRQLLVAYYPQLTPAERQIVSTPITVFDAQAYTNQLINHGNHKTSFHDLPLNGLAALFNVTNSHQHNAIWDVQTTELIIRKLAALETQPTVHTVQPSPLFAVTQPVTTPSEQTRRAKYALVHKLHARGKTYREIAAVTGISISGVNYILKKAVGPSPDHSVVTR